MAYAMTKQGSLDNCVTYEFICDTITDMNAIENRYRTIGSVAVVLQGESDGLEVYIAGSDKQWNNLGSMGASNSQGGSSGLSIYICAQNEVSNGLPDISEPDESTIYLVPAGNTSGNLYEEYIYANNTWEKFGSGGSSIDLSNYATLNDIPDIQINGISIVNNGVATIPYATDSSYGLIQPGNGLTIRQNQLVLSSASETAVKTGIETRQALVPARTNAIAFYGLAKAAGDETQAASDNAVGTYTDNAKAAIRNMIGAAATANPEFTGSISLGRKVNTTVGLGSCTFGGNATADGQYSHAEGYYTSANKLTAHAEGYNTIASNTATHAEGYFSAAHGYASHAEGRGSAAYGAYSHAEGYNTTAIGAYSHTSGVYNVEDSYANWPEWAANTIYMVGDKVKRTTTSNNETTIKGYICKNANNDFVFTSYNWDTDDQYNYVEIIGNGKENAESNARALDWNGNEYLMGDLYVHCNNDSTGGTKVATEVTVAALTARVVELETQISSLRQALDSLIPPQPITDESGNTVTDENDNIIISDY